ncbi:MAG: hypothetical protein EXX96DRAFT_606855 [Benjaminiella poitrasii]|nr:MAG: hypothetical protein EXX96DRAFT_606855 [Benjaminiella poitrasii]
MEFLKAVSRNDIEKVRTFLQSNIDVNSAFIWNSKDTYSPVIPSEMRNRPDLLNNLQADQKYHTKALNIAVFGGHADMVRLLLSAGADINSKDGRGRTALVCAIYGLDLDASNINTSNLHLISQTNMNHFDIMKNILLCHPNLHYATLDSPQYEIKGITPLCLASYLGKASIIQLLLEDDRVNVDGTDSKNATALMYAARDGNVPIVKILLGYHASPDITDSHGWSAIQYAERIPEIVQLCEEVLRAKRSELSVTSNNYSVNYPINYAKLSHLISSMPNYSSSLSHLRIETLKEIDHLDPAAAPLVHIVQSAFLQAIKLHDHSSLQTLLMKPLPLDDSAANHGPLLINYHDPKTGLTAIHHAMRTKPLPSPETITMLFLAGADMNAQTYYGRTALHHLSRFGLDKDGKLWGIQKSNKTTGTIPPANIKSVPEHLSLCASLLIRFGTLVNIADPIGNTPLHFAAEFGGVLEVLEVLILGGGADLTLKNKKGLTPLDVAKSDEIKQRMLRYEAERKHSSKARSIISSLNGTIRPFDSASEYNRHSVVCTTTPSLFRNQETDKPRMHFLTTQKQLLMDVVQKDASSGEYSDFEIILKSFFGYQTTFTDSIETSLAYLTESILGSCQLSPQKHAQAFLELGDTIDQLRYELREAHEMFDATDQLVEKVMRAFREELEQVEQVHQADWEMSELQNDKIEKLFDVFERIDGRFCQLELAQDDLVGQLERLRKAAVRRQQTLQENDGSVDIGCCITHVLQSLLILQTVPTDHVLYLRDDRNRLSQEMTVAVEQVLGEIEKHPDKDSRGKLGEAKALLEECWIEVKELLTRDGPLQLKKEEEQGSTDVMPRSISQPTTLRQKEKVMSSIYKLCNKQNEQHTLNELELSFDILQSNLYEIQKDVEEVTEHLEKIMQSKKKMYEICLSLEKELSDDESERIEEEIRTELNQVLKFTQQLFDKQHTLNKEHEKLMNEYTLIEQRLEKVRDSLYKVRPPALLQGLLDRLDTDETNYCVHVEKDWKEDSNLVAEIIIDEQHEESDDSSESSASSRDYGHHYPLATLQIEQLNTQCASKLSTLCYITRLDASLYCLKVLASHSIGKSRQSLIQVQASLGHASTDLDGVRSQMTQLYDDAAEVARQVFALKIEMETIVRHRKEEVIKVWEVVDEVSEGLDTKVAQAQQIQQQTPTISGELNMQQRQQQQQQQQQNDSLDEQDRHQWIIRELEQLQRVHENLEGSIEELKQEQAMISQSLHQLSVVFIEPQVDRLVGQNDESLLSISDRLAELMDRIRDNDMGLRPSSFWSPVSTVASKKGLRPSSQQQQQVEKSATTGVGLSRSRPRIVNKTASNANRLSLLSAATSRLSTSTYNSNYSSSFVRSPSSVIIDSHSNNRKRLSAAVSIKTDMKRMSIVSTTSLSSLSSYQQERVMAKASNLSSALSKIQQESHLRENK